MGKLGLKRRHPKRLPSLEALKRSQEALERPVGASQDALIFGPLHQRHR
jgi:hypothetical protein